MCAELKTFAPKLGCRKEKAFPVCNSGAGIPVMIRPTGKTAPPRWPSSTLVGAATAFREVASGAKTDRSRLRRAIQPARRR